MAGHRPLLDTGDKAKIVRLYVQEKLTVTAICRRFGVSSTTVYNALEASGVKRTANANKKLA